MLVSNYPIGATGGHADDDPFPPERVAPLGPLQGVCNGPDPCRAAVRFQVKLGADLIKFMPSGGVFSLSDPVDNPQLTQEEMNAIVSEAHSWPSMPSGSACRLPWVRMPVWNRTDRTLASFR